jgi:hypothetical protein
MLHRFLAVGGGALLLLLTLGGRAQAGAIATPEVDPSSMAGALVLLAAGGALLAERMRRTRACR